MLPQVYRAVALLLLYKEKSKGPLSQICQLKAGQPAHALSKYNISKEDYRMIELLMVERKSHKTGPQWKFAGSFYYALVTLALIGWVWDY